MSKLIIERVTSNGDPELLHTEDLPLSNERKIFIDEYVRGHKAAAGNPPAFKIVVRTEE